MILVVKDQNTTPPMMSAKRPCLVQISSVALLVLVVTCFLELQCLSILYFLFPNLFNEAHHSQWQLFEIPGFDLFGRSF